LNNILIPCSLNEANLTIGIDDSAHITNTGQCEEVCLTESLKTEQ